MSEIVENRKNAAITRIEEKNKVKSNICTCYHMQIRVPLQIKIIVHEG